MSDTTYYEAKGGLRCIFVKREGFQSKYVGLGLHYGSSHKKYYRNGEFYESKSGIAHFLEHKLFEQEDGVNALDKLTKMGANPNAYTSFFNTLYYKSQKIKQF